MRFRRRMSLVFAAAQITGLLWAGAGSTGAATLPPSEWVIGPQKRVVVLTFDGRAKSEALLRVLADLSDRNARASFFFPGAYVRKHPDKARLALAGGHKLGNAGWGKERFTQLSDTAIR